MKDYRNGIEQNLAPIALEFFATFSRFEFALKRGAYAAGYEGLGDILISEGLARSWPNGREFWC